ncbi:3(or 17)beta-hydroxysteroid dehydrogenase [Trinickia symbiotica]|nr:SDR family oxidoreductase [Trinickia symbiotica]PPK47050.1 3(or 17)beta-hydroxysteroid dehydrogenase [Trinickia symbiotica]
MSMGRLAGKVAIVTGGASGMGAATVKRFRAEGAEVFVADIQEDLGGEVAKETGATFARLDVASNEDWISLAAQVEKRFGRLDVLFNNAGVVGGENTVDRIDLAVWNRLISINQTGVLLGCHHAVKLMRRNPGGSCGSIINTASTVSYVALSHDIAYSATKAAVRNLTKSVAVWCAQAKTNIRCNSIHPGPIDTAIFSHAVPAGTDMAPIMKALNAMAPVGRMGRPEEVAAAAVFFASDEAPFVTGAELVVDGGMIAVHPDLPRE